MPRFFWSSRSSDEDLLLDRDIKRARGLVREQHVRILRKRDRDDDALLHAARELVRIHVEPALRIGNADISQQRDAALPHDAELSRPVPMRTASASWAPTVSTGLSALAASWNTMPILRRRRSRSWAGARPSVGSPPMLNRPARDRDLLRVEQACRSPSAASTCRSRIRPRPPACDPRLIARSTPRTTSSRPSSVRNAMRKPRTATSASFLRRRGSLTARTAALSQRPADDGRRGDAPARRIVDRAQARPQGD